MIEIDNAWPVWLIAAAVLLTLIPKAVQGLAILIPPLSSWLQSREKRLGFDAQLITRLLDVVERTLEERAGAAKENLLALEKLEKAIDNQARHIERGNQLFTVINSSLTGLADRVSYLDDRVIHLSGLITGKDGKGSSPRER